MKIKRSNKIEHRNNNEGFRGFESWNGNESVILSGLRRRRKSVDALMVGVDDDGGQ